MTSNKPLSKQRGDNYVLARDYKSASRLNYEHFLWKESLGYDLHPTILQYLSELSIKDHDNGHVESNRGDENNENNDGPSPPRIADIACGTGIWLHHVSQQLPHAQLDGYDISLAQCPPQQWLSSNIRLREWDLFTEPEPDMLAAYDVVHVRLLFVVVRDENPGPILENLKRLLKPGGYIQWDELNVLQSFILRTGDDVKAPLMERRVGGMKRVGMWVGELGKWMERSGFGDVRGWEVEEREGLARAFFDNHLAKDREMVEGKGEDGLRGVEGIYEESKGGAVICTPKIVWTGRKGW